MGAASPSSVIRFAGDPSSNNRHASGLLSSWKDISTYLSRGVRTVQRWEQDLGLPVHRTSAGKRAPVFAFEQEIDGWLREKAKANGRPVRTQRAQLNPRQQRLIQSVRELSQNALALERQVATQVLGPSPDNTGSLVTFEQLTEAVISFQKIMDALLTVEKLLNTVVAQSQLAMIPGTKARAAASDGGKFLGRVTDGRPYSQF